MWRAFLALCFVLLVGWGCDNSISNSKDIVFPEKNVSFNQHVLPFLTLNCGYAGCHSTESQAGGIVLTYYPSLMSALGVVVIDNPNASRLTQIIEDKVPHLTDFYRGNITENHKKGIRTWISEGANNN